MKLMVTRTDRTQLWYTMLYEKNGDDDLSLVIMPLKLITLGLFVIFFFFLIFLLIWSCFSIFSTSFYKPTNALKSTLAIIFYYFICIFFVQFDCWETVNLGMFQFICSSIHLCNYDISLVLVFLTQFIINWSKLFTMATPWSIKFN
ncbi:hypothetical protein X975_22922, partial [Stegodyphus mimosarum]